MGKKKRDLKAIQSWQERVEEHRDKIEAELKRSRPRWALIEFWQKQILTWQRQIEQRQRRLKR
ncbi:hypothetical protein LM602_00060 [Candidatus Acetothermia bacterium]|jgi:hypothetical protein|nr:hypothetical protein [Candidatus Acetothermia bacterium]MCI2430940.1 hypothetical protein [Candidatus Acetothermia bacterium]MCI2437038.1 hypothetical protein [Candidatus Acetothermia bacterium]